MRLVTSFCFVLALMVSTAPATAQIIYQWVPDAGSGGAGQLVFDDTYLAANADGLDIVYTDPGNFITPFGPDELLSISFTFDNGFSIDQALGFSGSTTIQTDLATAQFAATNGEIAGFPSGSFSFDYTVLLTNPNSSYLGTNIDPIFCLVKPCPQAGAHFGFEGPFDSESNTGRFVLVPEPTSLAVLGFSALAFAARRRVA